MRFCVEHPTANLQVLRAVHAFAEAGHTLCVSTSDAPVIAYLAERFPLQWEIGEAPAVSLEIDHATPPYDNWRRRSCSYLPLGPR